MKKATRSSSANVAARRTLLSALVSFLLIQLGFHFGVENWWIYLRDPEYGYKLGKLNHLLRKNPDSPLLLILGSSRSEVGILPSEFVTTHEGEDGAVPVAFNMSLAGSGPIFELLCLKRILGAGIHPRWAVIEVLPAMLCKEPVWSDFAWLQLKRLTHDELEFLCTYDEFPDRIRGLWYEAHAVPMYTNRFSFLSHLDYRWLPQSVRTDDWQKLDAHGWRYGAFPKTIDHTKRIEFLGRTQAEYINSLNEFAVSEKADRALHKMLDLCRKEKIEPLLCVMPESERFRSWYPPATRTAVNDYLRLLEEEYDLPVVDASDWFHEEDFIDGHHLLEDAARIFSRRVSLAMQALGFAKPKYSPTSFEK